SARGAHHQLEVAGRSIVALDEAGDPGDVVRSEDRSILPLPGTLIEVAMVEAAGGGLVDHLEVAVEGRAGDGGRPGAVVRLGLTDRPVESQAISHVVADRLARDGGPDLEVTVAEPVAALVEAAVVGAALRPRIGIGEGGRDAKLHVVVDTALAVTEP